MTIFQAHAAHLAAPTPLQPQPIQKYIRIVAFDCPVPPALDLRIDLLVQLAHRARANQ